LIAGILIQKTLAAPFGLMEGELRSQLGLFTVVDLTLLVALLWKGEHLPPEPSPHQDDLNELEDKN